MEILGMTISRAQLSADNGDIWQLLIQVTTPGKHRPIMSPPELSRALLPDHLQHDHFATLQSQHPLYFVFQNVKITIFPRLQSATPARYEAQQYLRIWNRDMAMQADLLPNSETISICSENIYQVYGKIAREMETEMSMETGQDQDTYLVAQTREMETLYYLLRYRDFKPLVTDESVEASLTGPFKLLPHILSQSVSEKAVSVLFSSRPIPADYAIPELDGAWRGDTNLPEKASRTVHFEPSCRPELTSAVWEELLVPIGRKVDNMSPSGNAVSLLCREIYSPYTDQCFACIPVVTITAQPQSSFSAQQTLYEIQHILCRRGFFDMEITLEVGVVCRNRKESFGGIIKYHKQPLMGDSIGRSEEGKSYGATAGGYVYLSSNDVTDDKSQRFIITCHHSVDKTKIPISSASQSHHVDSPTSREMKKSIRLLKEKRTRSKQDLKRAMEHGDNPIITERALRVFQKTIDTTTAEIEALNIELPLRLGHVLRSSGLTNSNLCQYPSDPRDGQAIVTEMDWALISVDAARLNGFPYNTVSGSIVLSDEFAVTQEALADGTLQFRSIKPWSDHEPGPKVVKMSKYGNIKYGTVNPRRSRTCLDNSIGLAYVIPHTVADGVFSVKGDSGCWVLDMMGCAVGMVFGSSENKSFCMDLMEVVQDIKEKTGHRVTIAAVP